MSAETENTVEISNTRGLHARAAAKVVKTTENFECDILIRKDDMTVTAQSIMGLLMLGAAKGSFVTISASGKDSVQAVAALTDLIENKFGEDQ